MKNIFKALKLPIVSLLFLTSFIACDKDFSVIESDVLGEANTNFITKDTTLSVVSYNKKLEALEVSNLNAVLLGFFNDAEYGKSTASIITQLTPSSFQSTASSTTGFFGINPEVEEVILNIPYFSTGSEGNTTYQLDSIYGSQNSQIKLTIYRSNYFLKDFDGNSTQKYYSNASNTFNSAHNGSTTINFDDHSGEVIFTTDNFIASNEATVVTTMEGTEEVVTRSDPAFRQILDNAFWQETILNKQDDDDGVFRDLNKFKNYFRGLYFKAEAISDNGAMVLLNLNSSNANITIHYTKGEVNSRTNSTYVLNFTGNKLNAFINDFNNPLVDGDKINGDETLYLKGIEGSMAVVDLFGTEDLNENSIPDKLEKLLKDFRKTDNTGKYILDDNGNYILKRLINEAHLAIYEDESKVLNTVDDNDDSYHKYDRIYAYDIKNNITTIDYQFDATENTNPLFSKIFSLGQRNEISQTDVKYKIQITEHLNNIIQNDSTNYKIGLVLSNNVNYTSNSGVLNGSDDVTAVPSASIISPRGTILHGSNAIDKDKRLALKIFYTKTKED